MSIESYRSGDPQKNLENLISEDPLKDKVWSFDEKLRSDNEYLAPATWEDFKSIYSEGEIKEDYNSIPDFETYSGEWSNMISQLVADGVYNHNWFEVDDPNWETHVELAQRYDDVKNGVDIIIVFYDRLTKAELLLVLDTTTSSTGVKEKEGRIETDIKNGYLRRLKYYRSPKSGKIIGKRIGVPGIIYLSPKKLEEIADRYKTEGDAIWHDPALNIEGDIRDKLLAQIDKQIKTANQTHGETNPRKAEQLVDWLTQIRDLLEKKTGPNNEKEAIA